MRAAAAYLLPPRLLLRQNPVRPMKIPAGIHALRRSLPGMGIAPFHCL